MSSAGDVLRLRESLSGKLDEREPIPQRFRATMGDGTGAVVVPGKPNYVYVRRLGRGLIEECLNNKAAARDGLPIIAGYSHESPDVLQVLEVDWYSFSAPGAYPYTKHHHEAHELHNVVGGDDVVWVQSQQLMPLLVYPTNPATMFVNVFGGWYPWASGWHYFEPTLSADLTAHIPALVANARYVLISIDGATEALQYTAGAVFSIFMPPVDAENMIPAPPAGSIPIGAVYLPNGTATLDWDNLYDMRLFNQPVGGSITPGVHALLDTTVHSDTATDAPTQGSLIIGNATPAWDELVHPGAAGYALVSGAATFAWSLAPTWLGTHTWGSGFDLLPTDATGQALGAVGTRWDLHTQDVYFEGASGANEITVPDNTAIALEILDAGGLEYMRIVSTDASPYLLIDSGATGFLVGVGVAVPTGHLDVRDATVSTTATYYGGRFDHTKTAGVTDTADRLFGLMGNVEFNQGGGIIGYVDGLSAQATMTAGEIGQGGTVRHLRGLICVATHTGGTTWGDVVGSYLVVDVNAGTIGRDIFGSNIVVDIEAAVTSIGQNVYGLRVWMDVDQDPVGTVYGVHLTEGTNQDFGFYQSGSAVNYFGGSVGIGTTTPVALEHLYSTANVARGIVIDAKGTGISQSAFLNFLTVGTGAVDVGNAASQGWHFTARGNAYTTAAAQNDLLIYFWDGAGWALMQYWDHLGNVGIGVSYPVAKCHIDQASTTATIPVLILDQADTSEGFINFIGSDRGVILSDTDSLRSVRVEWNGTVYRLALYVDA